MGLPVLVGHRKVCFFFMSPCFPPTSTGHSFRDIWEKICRHITVGGIHPLFQKFWVSDPPGGIFSQIFLQDFDLKIKGSHGADPEKNMQKNFLAPDPPGLGGVASKVLELRFLNFSTRLQATVLAIYGCKFAGTLP